MDRFIISLLVEPIKRDLGLTDMQFGMLHGFAFGPLRAAGAGARTVVGIMAGVLFVLLTQTLENSGQLFDLPPWVVGWGPTAILATLTFVLLARVR